VNGHEPQARAKRGGLLHAAYTGLPSLASSIPPALLRAGASLRPLTIPYFILLLEAALANVILFGPVGLVLASGVRLVRRVVRRTQARAARGE